MFGSFTVEEFIIIFSILYTIIINLLGIILMALDKRKARKNLYRISEKTLFKVSWLGGAAGVWFGMIQFKHKTLHRSFKYGVPLICLCNWLVLLGIGYFYIVYLPGSFI
ncbi:DUF1294 domain-containing protein (plasmid) [Rossellomorea sp. AcN35-11]|nr:DUF1294 domain-containing protein [Rossellomorea aquimaris]WJV32423.1 DUF1294 domain-containing protein [Rossellomorea sp. AcN35-11]